MEPAAKTGQTGTWRCPTCGAIHQVSAVVLLSATCAVGHERTPMEKLDP